MMSAGKQRWWRSEAGLGDETAGALQTSVPSNVLEITVEELVSGEARVRRITERSHQICPEEILIPSDFPTR